ncbi:MAG: SMC-Scp complex subunit ScpB [Oscillospiraceae bacterium]|nr:SMC-Scp complex subunit ScpB [Oscillospiraceae bacterium]
MNTELYKSAVEAVLFAVAEPISAEKIADAVAVDAKTVSALLAELQTEYDDAQRGVVLLRFDDRYQLATRPVFADFVVRALDNRRNTPLSQAALEVLSIVAYNQPVSRSFIDQIRGVDSSSPVASLLAKNLICEAGRLDLPGRPVSFKTTDNFLRCFGLSSTAQLPPVYSEELELTDDAPAEDEDGDLFGE